MSRNEYMKELELALRRLPKAEREEALSYYNEYFDDAGREREAEVIEELGDAKESAAQIVKELALKRLEEPKPERAARKGLSTLWIVLLALCAAPIGLPLLLLVVVFGLAMVLMVFSIFVALFLSGVVFVAVGIVSIVAGFYFIPSQLASGIFILGTALGESGVGLLLICAGCASCKYIYQGMAGFTKRLLTRGDKK
ncbi:DUF1700 domain-containing protein [Hungatella sp. SB206]|uniref:DUF1700 domain-containing protein n=1 Tax=Hungatella sp. SB206 TaxID=2937758 RepID=UPI003DA7E927